MRNLTIRCMKGLIVAVFGAALLAPNAGCEMSCRAEDQPVEEAGEDIGDAVEDAADELEE